MNKIIQLPPYILSKAMTRVRFAFLYLQKNGLWKFAKRLAFVLFFQPSARAPLEDREQSRLGKHYDVIFVVGCWEGESKRYRVFNSANALSEAGFLVKVISFSNLPNLKRDADFAKIVVLFRAPDDEFVDEFMRYAKENRIKVVFDIDDLVFDPKIIADIAGYRLLTDAEKINYIDGVNRYRRLLLKADIVTVPTISLLEEVFAIEKDGRLVKNTYNKIQLNIAKSILQKRDLQKRDCIKIGYFSGSRTHNEDFLECQDALFKILTEYDNIKLVLVGELDIDPQWNHVSSKIERHNFKPYTEMLKILAECDINIAPLKLENRFNNAKSELKWFEAALVAVPTIASATVPFNSAIEDRSTGILARTESDWYGAIKDLINNKHLRQTLGENARKKVIDFYGPSALLADLLNAYELDFPEGNQIGANDKLTIAWIVPGLIIGGGGHRNIIRAAFFLEKFGHEVILYFDGPEPASVYAGMVVNHFYPFNGLIKKVEDRFEYSDVTFATHWSTVKIAKLWQSMTREIMYFVQDFEPYFSPMGSEYVLAENTYRQGFYCITSGRWCSEFLRDDYNAEADHIDFPIDRDVYFPREGAKKPGRLLFFAKPEMPRRCYELGKMVLEQVHRMDPNIEIIFFGSNEISRNDIGFKLTVVGVVPTLQELAELYSSASAALVFSTTNPSLVPYEIMACGTPIIDLNRPKSSLNYGGREDVALLCDPDPTVMATQIIKFLNNPDEVVMRVENGIELTNGMPTEEATMRRLEKLIINRLHGA